MLAILDVVVIKFRHLIMMKVAQGLFTVGNCIRAARFSLQMLASSTKHLQELLAKRTADRGCISRGLGSRKEAKPPLQEECCL